MIKQPRAGIALIASCMLLAVTALALPTPAACDISMGVLKITSNPAGAKVVIDGEAKGRTPLLVEVTAGKHEVTLEHPERKKATKRIRVAPDKITRAHVKLKGKPRVRKQEPRDEPPPEGLVVHHNDESAEPGTVTLVTTPPGLTVFMNDYLIPQPTPVAFDIRAGTYELRIEEEGETVLEKTVFVQPGKTLALDLTIKKVRRIDYGDPWE